MHLKKNRLTAFLSILFILLSGIGEAQQTINHSRQELNADFLESLYQKDFIGLAGALSWESILEAELSNQIRKSTFDRSRLTNILAGLRSGDPSSVEKALDWKVNEDPGAHQLLSFALAQFYFKRSNYIIALDHFDKIDPTYFSNEVNELIQFQKGFCFFSLNQFEKSKPYFQSILQLTNSEYKNSSRYYLGFIAFSNQDLKLALENFTQLRNAKYYDKVVPFYIAYVQYQNGEVVAAIETAERYINSGAALHEKETTQLLANIYFNTGQFQKSTSLYERSTKSKTDLSASQFFELGVGYFYLGNYDKSIEILKPLTSTKDSIAFQSLFFLANAQLKSGDLKSARNSFSLCLPLRLPNDQHEMALFDYSKLSLQLGFKDEGLKKMNEFLQLYPGSKFMEKANDVLLIYFSKTNEFKQAASLLKKYATVDLSSRPYVLRIYFGRSLELINEGDLDQALTYLDDILKFKSSTFYYPSLFWKAEIFHRKTKYDQSIRIFSEYLKFQSAPEGVATRTNAYYSLATAYYETGSYSSAYDLYNRIWSDKMISDLSIKNESLVRAADCALMMNNTSKARSLYAQSLKENPSDYVSFQLAILEGIVNPMEKIRMLEKLILSYPKSSLLPRVTIEIADTYIAEEKFEMAIPFLTDLMRLVKPTDPLYVQALLNLGVVYYNIDRSDDAIIQFKKILIDHPSSPEAKDAVESAKAIYVENGRLNDFAEFLKIGGVELGSYQKDSLTYQFVQKKLLDSDSVSTLAAIESYLNEFPSGLYRGEVLNYKIQLLYKNRQWVEFFNTVDQISQFKSSKYRVPSLRIAASAKFFELRDYSGAVKYYESLLNEIISDEIKLESLKGIVRSFYYLQYWQRASDFAEQLLKSSSASDDQAYSNLIMGYLEQENQLYDLSSEYHNKVLNGSSTILKPEAAYQLAYNTFKTSSSVDAEKRIVSLIEQYGTDDFWNAKCYIILGDIFISQKDYFNARATLQSILDNTENSLLKNEVSAKLKMLDALEQKKVPVK